MGGQSGSKIGFSGMEHLGHIPGDRLSARFAAHHGRMVRDQESEVERPRR